MNVDQTAQHPHLLTELRLIDQALDKGIPVLGICLGAQLIAKALGAAVRRNGEREIGWYDVALTKEGKNDTVLRHFGETEKVFQWHGDTFDVPGEAERLAVSLGCQNQAFRFGSNVYGFQFHLEVDQPLVERWLSVPIHRKELESLKGRIDPNTIRRETTVLIDGLKQLSDRTFVEFIKLFRIRKRRLAHPSR
jgi:GMP synthase (glutamine-hydrolysing)